MTNVSNKCLVIVVLWKGWNRLCLSVLVLGMLIPGKSHSRVESRNSRISIETLSFTRVQSTFTCVTTVGSGRRQGREGGGTIAGQSAPDAVPGMLW